MTDDNYGSYKTRTGFVQWSSVETKIHWSRLAVDWTNTYEADSGYGPFQVVVDAEYEGVDSEGEGTGAYQTRQYTAPMGYESSGRLTWQPPLANVHFLGEC